MKALVMTRYGSPDVVELRDMPKPELGAKDVLIEVHAASINPLDFKIREGKLRLIRRFKLPVVMGNDLAGTVVAVGAGVTLFQPGDEVYARVAKDRLGAFAEFAAVDESYCALKPKNLSMEEAAGIPLAGLTAWQALHEELVVQPQQKILIPAGAGGVGQFAIQLAKHAGAKVATTASGRGLDLVRELGADLVVDYKHERLADRVKDLDGVFDTLGGADLDQAFALLRRGGAVCSIAGAPEPSAARKMGAAAPVRLAFWLASRDLRKKAEAAGVRYTYIFMRPDGGQLAHLAQLAEAGALKVRIDKVLPLEQGKEAMAYLETGRAKGKVIIKVKGGR